MGLINKELDNLRETDIWSLLLFVLFKMHDLPEYSTLSELSLILDKCSFLKLCEYFGGLTIKIPSINDLEVLLNSLILYKEVDLENKDLETLLDAFEATKRKSISDTYIKMRSILSNYDFKSAGV